MSPEPPQHVSTDVNIKAAYAAYRSGEGQPILIPSCVLFLDVLGVEDGACGEDRLDFLRRLRHALEDARTAGRIDRQRLHVRALFSDSIIAAFPLQGGLRHEEVIGIAETMAARVQLELIKHGFFLRGGLSFGLHYMDPDFAFGPALVEAAVLEREAVGPRVVLSVDATNAERLALTQSDDGGEAPQRQYLVTDADGITFISYLDVLIDVEDEEDARESLSLHRAAVITKLREYAGRPKIESKYLWAAQYHNFVCQHTSKQPLGRDHLIDLDELSSGLNHFGWDIPARR